MVMGIEENALIPIIVGRPFLFTAGVMVDVKNGKLFLHVRDEKVGFYLPQTMTAPTLDDTCCKADVLEKILNRETMNYHSMDDPLEDILIGRNVTDS